MSARLLIALFAALLSTATAADTAEEACVVPPEFKALWPDKDKVRFRPTTLQERAVFSELLPSLLKTAVTGGLPTPDQKALAEQADFTIDVWELHGQRFFAVREKREAQRGAGAYVLRAGAAQNVVVQSPHAYFDLGTGAIGAELFVCAPEGARPRAFFTNTAHRFKGRPGERRADPDHPADLAHNGDHLFQVATDLMARALPAVRVVQLHGFGEKANKGRKRKLSAVVSSGTDAASPYIRNVATRMTEVVGDGVRTYPDETGAFGGTQNAQSRLLQLYPNARFVHLELSANLRRKLRRADDLERLARALFAHEGE